MATLPQAADTDRTHLDKVKYEDSDKEWETGISGEYIHIIQSLMVRVSSVSTVSISLTLYMPHFNNLISSTTSQGIQQKSKDTPVIR